MFGGLGNIAGLMKQAKAIQENMARLQESLESQRFEGEAGAGMVKATVNGRAELVRIKIDPQAAADTELLEDLVVAAVSTAARKAQESVKAEMAQMTGGLNLPGLSGLFGQGG